MFRSVLYLALGILWAVPSRAQTNLQSSDLGGNPSTGSGILRFGEISSTGCTYAIEIYGGGEITFYVVNTCTGGVEKFNAPSLRSASQSEPAGTAPADVLPATTGGAATTMGQGSEGLTTATLADGTQMVAWIAGGSLSTGVFTGTSNTAQITGQYPTGPNPQHVIAGDFNGDGNVDLAVCNFGSLETNLGGNIAIFLGNGAGSFTAGATVNVDTASAMYAADFNGDGKLDLAVANANDNTISILLGNGNGTFQAPAPYAVSGSPHSLVAGDFNGDGDLDLAVADYSGGVSILLGNGDGTFQAAQGYSSGNGRATYIAWMDLNGDGKPDLIVANPLSNAIAFLFGNGNGSFQPPTEYATGADPQYFALLSGNGQVLIATIDGLSGNAAIMQVLPNGVATAPPIYAVPEIATGVAAADLNGDGFPDMVAADQAISVLLRIPGAGFSPVVNYPLQSGSEAVGVAIADINGDGKKDVVAASITSGQSGSGGTLDVALNNGDGTLGTQSSYALGGNPGGLNGNTTAGLAIGDFNGDGKPDVAAGYQTSVSGPGGISVLINQGGGSLAAAVNYEVAGLQVFGTIAGDFNGDDHLDLAAAAGPSNSTAPGDLAILIGKGDGTFQDAFLTQVGSPAGTPIALAAGDVNNDGNLDIVASYQDANLNDHIVVLLGNGDFTFRQLTPFSTPASGRVVTLADLNGDGNLDLVVGDCCGQSESVYLLGNGDGTFQSAQYFSSGGSVEAVAVTDWNSNGVAGLAIAQEGETVEALESMLNPKLYSSPPTLSIAKSHTGNFTPGQQGATYTITVSNAANAAPVAGTVTVTDTVPSGLTLVSMTGNNWTCSANSCTRSDALTGGFTYDAITVTVNVSASASSPQVNMASVSGGGSASAAASDSTIIGSGSSCTYTLMPPPPMSPVPSGAGSGSVSVATNTGCAWTASSDSPWLTITAGSSGSGNGTVDYSVAANTATTARTGTLTIAGIAFPVTQLAPTLLTVSSTHTGVFVQGETGVYTVTVTDMVNTSPASGTVTVTDNLPTGLTLVSMSGTGWTCTANSCSQSGTLQPGMSYPGITVTVNVAASAPSMVTNQVTVSGAGSPSGSGSDVTTIVAPTCAFTLASPSAALTQSGTASSGGVLPEMPVTVGISAAAGASCAATYTASSTASWLSATTNAGGFTYTALTNPHPSSRSATLTIANPLGGSATFTVTEAGDPEPLLYRQVRALYQSVLGRDPDSGGFTFWTGVGSAGLGQMLDSFLTSPEAFNSDFAVMAAYQAATGAAPTYAEFLAAVANVRAGTSAGNLLSSLIGTGYTVQNLYQNLLGRTPTAAEAQNANTVGLGPWFQTLIAYPSSVTPVTAANNEFMNTGTFATAPDHSNGLYVAMLYYVILNRDYDPSGYAFWVGVANTGGAGILFQGPAGYPTRIQILGPGTPNQGFAGSPEFQGLYQ